MGINLLHHSLDVAHLAGLIAAELGLDVRLAQRAGLLHDLGKTIEGDNAHTDRGVDLGEQYEEDPEVRDVMATHHDPNEGLSPYAFTVKAADYLASGQSEESIEASAPQVVQFDAVTDAHGGIQSADGVRVQDEVWVLIRGSNLPDLDALTDEIQRSLAPDTRIRLTVSP